MTLLQALTLGIVQGLTEFLPVSSTAHLLLTQALFGWHLPEDQAFSFDVLVQLGTLLSLILYFRRDLWEILNAILRSLRQRQPFAEPAARLGWLTLLATLPALAAGVLFKDLLEQLFKDPATAASLRLLITAVLLLIAEFFGRRTRTLDSLNWKDALWIGAAQVLSVFPGASRSGSTITGGMTRHLDRPAAARFAFLMSIPVMLAAGAYQSLDVIQMGNLTAFLAPLLVGFVAAAVVGYLAIHWLLSYLARHPLTVFAGYCFLLGLAILAVRILG
jgi:undecaprenyl-diphosphatase